VPEFLQDDATPENLAQALGNQVTDKGVAERIAHAFSALHLLLRQDTAGRAAEAILQHLPRA